MTGDSVTEYSVIDREGKITNYVWCDVTKQMVKQMNRPKYSDVILYAKDACQECERAEMLFNSENMNYAKYVLGQDFTEKQFRAEFGAKAEYPQIAIGTSHIGGLKETLQHLYMRDV